MRALGGTILVIDDDPDIREILRDRLEFLCLPESFSKTPERRPTTYLSKLIKTLGIG